MSARDQFSALPAAIADAATAAWVLGRFRDGDIAACAAAVAYGARDLDARAAFRLLTTLLYVEGAQAPEPGKAGRSFKVKRYGKRASKVLSLDFKSKHLVVEVIVLSENCARHEAKRARRAFFCRLTRQPIANDNDPEPCFRHGWPDYESRPPASFSPALVQRVKMQGRLAELAKAKRARIKPGAWLGMPCRRGTARSANGATDG